MAEIECIFDKRYIFFNKWRSADLMRADYAREFNPDGVIPIAWSGGIYAARNLSGSHAPTYYFNRSDRLISVEVIDYVDGDNVADLENWLGAGNLGGQTPAD